MRKFAEGRYEPEEEILHLWYPSPVHLTDEAIVEEFFSEALATWIQSCPKPPYLLVNYAHIQLPPNMVEAYSRKIQLIQKSVRGTFRYGMSADAQGNFTAVSVHLGNLKLSTPSHIFRDEAAARAAIRRARGV